MKFSLRGLLVIGALVTLILALGFLGNPWLFAQNSFQARSGQLTEQSLGNLLQSLGLAVEKNEQRYDFQFKALYDHGSEKEEWKLSMSAVLSQNGQSIWVMAWLKELPRSAADVPRTALLRLLAQNDRMGNGKFFAYVAGNRNFVLQRVVPNHAVSAAEFRSILQDLGMSVVETHSYWEVDNWRSKKSPASNQISRNNRQLPAGRATGNPRSPSRSAVNSTRRAIRN